MEKGRMGTSMKQSIFRPVIGAVLLTSLLAGCGSSGSSSAPKSDAAPAGDSKAQNVTLRFLHKWPEPDYMDFYKSAIAKFESSHPNIKVEMEAVADEPYKDKIRTVMASGNVPDIFFSWAGEFSWKFARAGQAMDLTQAFQGSDWKNNVVGSSVEPYKWQGKIYGIPINMDAKYMVYNKAIFAKLGLKIPTTWDEFQQVCEQLKAAGVTPISFGNDQPWASAHYIGNLNAHLVPGDVLQADYLLTADASKLFTDPGYVEALKRFKLLNDKGYFTKSPNAVSHSLARTSFYAGKAGMINLDLIEFPLVAKSELGADGFGFFRFPDGTGGKGDQNLLSGAPDGFMISAKTKYPKEAVEFLKFLTTPEVAAEYVKKTGVPSTTVGAVNAQTSLPVVEAGIKEAGKASAMTLWLDVDLNAKIVAVYLPGMQAVLAGSKTPEQLMAEVREVAVRVQKETK